MGNHFDDSWKSSILDVWLGSEWASAQVISFIDILM